MNKENEEIDELIRKALTEEEAEFYKKLDEPNFLEMFQSMFKGKQAWMGVFSTLYAIVAAALGIYCFIQFLQSETPKELIRWGIGILVFLIINVAIKIFQWQQMNKYVIMREIKRLELQITTLKKDNL